jgi:hypothetical protein
MDEKGVRAPGGSNKSTSDADRKILIKVDLIRQDIKKTKWRHEKATAAETFLQQWRLHSKQGCPMQTILPEGNTNGPSSEILCHHANAFYCAQLYL